MKVTPNVSSQVNASSLKQSDALQTKKTQEKEGTTKATLGEMRSSAKVDISRDAQRLKMAQEIASQPDTVDEAKVERLRKLIDSGEYKVSADKIADRLVDEHLLMPS